VVVGVGRNGDGVGEGTSVAVGVIVGAIDGVEDGGGVVWQPAKISISKNTTDSLCGMSGLRSLSVFLRILWASRSDLFWIFFDTSSYDNTITRVYRLNPIGFRNPCVIVLTVGIGKSAGTSVS
jgi:hypothetical protein